MGRHGQTHRQVYATVDYVSMRDSDCIPVPLGCIGAVRIQAGLHSGSVGGHPQ